MIDDNAARRLFQAVVTQALVDAVAVIEPYQPSDKPVTVKRKPGESDIHHQKRLNQAIKDAPEARRRMYDSRVGEVLKARREARNWLVGRGPDFEEVCHLAGYNPDDVFERARRLKAEGWPCRVEQLAA